MDDAHWGWLDVRGEGKCGGAFLTSAPLSGKPKYFVKVYNSFRSALSSHPLSASPLLPAPPRPPLKDSILTFFLYHPDT